MPLNSTRYRNLKAAFFSIQVPEYLLLKALRNLDSNRAFTSGGYILVNMGIIKYSLAKSSIPDEIGDYYIPLNTRIELLPAGKFLFRTLSSTSEYIFWMSLYTDLDSELFRPRRNIKSIDDDFRLKVATKFFEEYIFPKFKIEWEGLIASKKSFNQEKINIFGSDPAAIVSFPLQIIRGLRAFSNTSRIKKGADIEKKLRSIEGKIDSFKNRLSRKY